MNPQGQEARQPMTNPNRRSRPAFSVEAYRAAREVAGETNADVARALGHTEKRWGDKLSEGRRRPTAEEVVAIAAFLGLAPRYLAHDYAEHLAPTPPSKPTPSKWFTGPKCPRCGSAKTKPALRHGREMWRCLKCAEGATA